MYHLPDPKLTPTERLILLSVCVVAAVIVGLGLWKLCELLIWAATHITIKVS